MLHVESTQNRACTFFDSMRYIAQNQNAACTFFDSCKLISHKKAADLVRLEPKTRFKKGPFLRRKTQKCQIVHARFFGQKSARNAHHRATFSRKSRAMTHIALRNTNALRATFSRKSRANTKLRPKKPTWPAKVRFAAICQPTPLGVDAGKEEKQNLSRTLS